jgi:hypothetical protein
LLGTLIKVGMAEEEEDIIAALWVLPVDLLGEAEKAARASLS